MCPFKHSCISGQILLMNTSKGAQEVAESCPDTFLGIAVDFAEAITIIIAGILVPGMANGGMVSTSINNVVICRAFISIEGGGGSCVVFYFGLNCGLLSVVTDREANLTCGAPYHVQNGRAIVVHGAPIPRRLLARLRGGSSGSSCFSPFSPAF